VEGEGAELGVVLDDAVELLAKPERVIGLDDNPEPGALRLDEDFVEVRCLRHGW
jgi:hypothetical protein